MGGASSRRLRGKGRRPDLRRPRGDGPAPGHPEDAPARPPVRLPPGHGEEPLRHLGRAPRLLPALRRPGGTPRPPGLRLPRRAGAAAPLRLDLHGAAAREPLAGRRGGPAQGPHLRPARAARALLGGGVGPERGERDGRLPLPDGRARLAHAGALRPGTAPLRPRGARPAIRDAPDVARGRLDPRPHRGRGLRRVPPPAASRSRGQALASRGGPGGGRRERLRAPHPGERHELLLRVPLLPAEKRRAIYALYSFCRVVDDCVDEEGGEGEAGLARWERGGGPRLRRAPRHRAGPRSRPRPRPLPRSRGRAPRGHRGRLPDGPRDAPLRHLRGPPRVLRARGLRRRSRQHRGLRLLAIRARASTRSSSAWPFSSRTSCGTWGSMPLAIGSTCRSRTSALRRPRGGDPRRVEGSRSVAASDSRPARASRPSAPARTTTRPAVSCPTPTAAPCSPPRSWGRSIGRSSTRSSGAGTRSEVPGSRCRGRGKPGWLSGRSCACTSAGEGRGGRGGMGGTRARRSRSRSGGTR